MSDEPIYDYVERGRIAALTEQLAAMTARAEAAEAERDLSYRQSDEIHGLYKDLQKRSGDWQDQANRQQASTEARLAEHLAAMTKRAAHWEELAEGVAAQWQSERSYRDAAEARLAEALAALDERIASCGMVYPIRGKPYRESDPEKFSCASFCENFGHHTLLEIRNIIAGQPARQEPTP